MLLLKRGGLTRVLPGASGPRLGVGSARTLILAPDRALEEESWRIPYLPRPSSSTARPPVLPSAPSISNTGSLLSLFEWVEPPLLRRHVRVASAGSQWKGGLPGLLPCCPGQRQHKS
ncbi:hypothetical protein NDU88_011543 [Pleurodeles waltl]|uniref:Uncharacterized protein n=1 Tax=Pleurodeles waltl TaxID=8319 RepID=A0AAV7PYR1_PLEWA|nr:hypothetical protein NDU88_011543 [Pleurodeles waltl]